MTRTPLAVPLALGAVFAWLSSLTAVSDSDLFWHLANGQHTLGGGLARGDIFSWTIPGKAVLVDQWLGDVAIAVVYAAGSWSGIVALRAVAVLAVVALTLAGALRSSKGRPLIAVLASLPAIALTHFAWTDRPELLGLVAFTALVAILRDGRDRILALAVPLLLLWANLHGSYAIGLALVLAVCAERAVAEPARRQRLVLIALGAIVATLVTPSGLATWTASGGHFLAPPRYVAEEAVPDLRSLPGLIFAITAGTVIASALLARVPARREAVILLPVLFVSLTAARHMPFFAIAAAPYLAARGVEAIAALRPVAHPSATLIPQRFDALAALFAAGVVAVAVALAPNAPDERGYPVSALAALPAGPGLLNSYDWGGWLIWRDQAVPVFIDGRLFPYVPDVLDDYRAIVGLHQDWPEVVARRDVRELLLRPTDAAAVRAQELGWRVLSSSETYVLLARP